MDVRQPEIPEHPFLKRVFGGEEHKLGSNTYSMYCISTRDVTSTLFRKAQIMRWKQIFSQNEVACYYWWARQAMD